MGLYDALHSGRVPDWVIRRERDGRVVVSPSGGREGQGVVSPSGGREGQGVVSPSGGRQGQGVVSLSSGREVQGVVSPSGGCEGQGVVSPSGGCEGQGGAAALCFQDSSRDSSPNVRIVEPQERCFSVAVSVLIQSD